MSFPRLKVGLYAFLVAAVFVLASYRLFRRADSAVPSKDQVLIGTMLQGLTAAHYQPEKVDDAFSKRVFDLYLKHLDYRKQFLLASDVEQLRRYQTQIDDEVKSGTREFLDLSTKLMAERTKEMQGLYREILAKPFDFTLEETFQTDFEKATFPGRQSGPARAVAQAAEVRNPEPGVGDDGSAGESQGSQAQPLRYRRARPPPTPTAPTAAEPVRTPAQMEAEARKRVLKYYDEQFADMQRHRRQRAAGHLRQHHCQYLRPAHRIFCAQSQGGFRLSR